MAPNGRAEDLGYGDRAARNPDISGAEAALQARLSRKRTKTGCLTCRKRRIKCGEERPVCKNCIKSKRQCEGYNQRVVFKEPTFEYQPIPNGGAHITFQAGPQPGPLIPYDRDYDQVVTDSSFYSQQQSKPTGQYASPITIVEQRYGAGDQRQAHISPVSDTPHNGLRYRPDLTVQSDMAYHQAVNGTQISPHSSQSFNSTHVYPGQIRNFVQPVNYGSQAPLPTGFSGNDQARYPTEWQQTYPVTYEQQWSLTSPTTTATLDKASPTSSVSSKILPRSQSLASESQNTGWGARLYMARPDLNRPMEAQPSFRSTRNMSEEDRVTSKLAVQSQNHSPPELYEHEQHLPNHNTTKNLLSQAAVEHQDDDYYDVDEEVDVDTLAVTTLDYEGHQNLQRILQMSNASVHDLQTRRYETFLYEGILDHYRVEDAANPLKNPATARVFAHFISVTAPSLSVFERHARNASVLFTDGQIPLFQRGLWTYTMPIAALHHQGLLHSMLALGSLHIARLQNASDTPSRQHYAWACKRINSLLGPKSKKRHKTTTIAASMLLGFYEIFTADHRAWNLHLTGSRQLFLETDFLNMSRQFRRMKRDRVLRQKNAVDPASAWYYGRSQDEILDQVHDVDDTIISNFVGHTVTYDDHGQTMTPQSALPLELDLSDFEILRDLYWWYLKQDAYQSIISGNQLLLDYNRWANCPPRAPIGKVEAVYGSLDHLLLLLGRIADFSFRDRKRKLRQMEANGGQWRPASGMKMPQKPTQNGSQPNTPLSAANGQPLTGDYFARPIPQVAPLPQQPLFFGMAPAPRQNVQMPSAYNPNHSIPTPQPTSPREEPDLMVATNAALEEYGRIRAALHKFETSLGDAFNPLQPEYQVPLETPFGHALFYRSYDIACLWALYYMAAIIAIRSHPHMHPAAHAAAAIAANETAFFANEIGRITAGIVPGPPDQPLNPTMGAALWESCIPSFFAAIQYKSTQQRHATVMRIHEIGVRTGLGTAETIANGCETAWVKAAAAGRGPPYTRIVRPEFSEDPRLNGSYDGLDLCELPDRRDDPYRRLVRTNADARLTWAIGILGMEEDERSKVAA